MNKNDNIQRISSFRIPKNAVTRSKSVMVNNNKASDHSNKIVASTKLTDEIKDLQLSFHKQISLKCRIDQYFSQHSDKTRIISSKKSLSDLGESKLTTAEAIRLMAKLPRAACTEQINARLAELEEKSFAEVFNLLRNGFNVLAHGFGSKLGLMERFANRFLYCENCIVIPGFDGAVNLCQVFNDVIDSLGMAAPTQGKSPLSLATAIRDSLSCKSRHNYRLYFVISNIERLAIHSSLDSLVILAKCPNVSIFATVDHRFAERLLSKFEIFWVFCDWTTLLPYCQETSDSSSRFISQNNSVGLESLKSVSASLHNNAKQVFLLLAKLQLENTNQNTEGMLIDNLLCLSKDSLLVTNEIGLRNLLTEFKDHKLIQIKMVSFSRFSTGFHHCF